MVEEREADPFASLRGPLLYRTDGMDAVTPRHVDYRQTRDGYLPMDVYTPPNLAAHERRPAVLFVHGGPVPPELPPATEWGVFRGYGALAAASGWVGVTFQHRFHSASEDSEFDQLEPAEQDITAAIAYVRDHAAELQVDAERLCLWAFSGGGLFLSRALRERPAHIRCLVAYYALMDVRPMATPEERASFAAMARLTSFSPVAAVNPGSPPILVARSGQDHPDLNVTIDAFIQAGLTHNRLLEVLTYPHGQHGFDSRDDMPLTREIIARTLDFVRERFEGEFA
jgi:acetyl esterase/lipase